MVIPKPQYLMKVHGVEYLCEDWFRYWYLPDYTKLLPAPLLTYCQKHQNELNPLVVLIQTKLILIIKMYLKMIFYNNDDIPHTLLSHAIWYDLYFLLSRWVMDVCNYGEWRSMSYMNISNCLTCNIWHFIKTDHIEFRKNAQIYLPCWQYYLTQAVKQWNTFNLSGHLKLKKIFSSLNPCWAEFLLGKRSYICIWIIFNTDKV